MVGQWGEYTHGALLRVDGIEEEEGGACEDNVDSHACITELTKCCMFATNIRVPSVE